MARRHSVQRLLRQQFRRARKLFGYVFMMRGLSDIATYHRLWSKPDAIRDPATLYVWAAPGIPLACRPGTGDAITLWETFHHRFHLPNRKLKDPK